jgi:hypothetical protein
LHLQALQQLGVSMQHRQSFAPVKKVLMGLWWIRNLST